MSATRAPVLACLSASLVLLSTPLASAEPSTGESTRSEDAAAASAAPDAAQTPDVKATKEKGKKIEEITITARRREESLEQAPLTVTAFDSEELEANDIRSLEDVTQFVPNLQFDQAAGSSNASRIYLRGVGNGDTIITDDNGVGIYVDSVFLPRAAGTLLAVSDVERVEVLAGPQGTLYGKNTIGGLVNYITRKPQWEYEGNASLRVGTYGQLDTGLVMNFPLVNERAALRVSLATRSNDGYARNSFRNQDVQDSRSLNGRVQLLLQPAEELELLFSAAQSVAREHGYAPKCKFNTEPGGLTARLFPGFGEACRDDEQRRSVRRVARDGQLEDELKTISTYMQMTWTAADWMTVKSTTAWNRNNVSGSGDGDATQFPVFNGAPSDFDKGQQDSIAQELNFSGEFDVAARKVNWIGGFFGLVEDNFDKQFDTDRPSTVTEVGGTPVAVPKVIAPFAGVETLAAPEGATAGGFIAASNGFGPCIDTPVTVTVDGTPTGTPVRNAANTRDLMACTRMFEGVQTKSRLRSNVTSYAAFGNFDIALTDKLSFAAGVRYTHERRRTSRFRQVSENDRARLITPLGRGGALQLDGIRTDFERSIRIGKWTPSLSLTYVVNDSLTLYANHSRGFKSGGFNGRVEGDGNERVEYDPEILSGYEAGFKSDWLDRRLIVNAAYFHSDYVDVQLPNVQITNGGRLSVVVDNAGRASINGLDLSITGRVTSALTLRATTGITAARYEKFDGGNSNDRLIGTPTYSGSLTASYRMDVGRFGELSSRLTWSHQGQKASDSADNRSTHVNKYGTLSGGLSLALPDGKTEIALNGSNLLNREYFLTGISLGNTTLRYFAPPRQFSVEIRRDF
jgi:iron complex outermembrane recepter protein